MRHIGLIALYKPEARSYVKREGRGDRSKGMEHNMSSSNVCLKIMHFSESFYISAELK